MEFYIQNVCSRSRTKESYSSVRQQLSNKTRSKEQNNRQSYSEASAAYKEWVNNVSGTL